MYHHHRQGPCEGNNSTCQSLMDSRRPARLPASQPASRSGGWPTRNSNEGRAESIAFVTFDYVSLRATRKRRLAADGN